MKMTTGRHRIIPSTFLDYVIWLGGLSLLAGFFLSWLGFFDGADATLSITMIATTSIGYFIALRQHRADPSTEDTADSRAALIAFSGAAFLSVLALLVPAPTSWLLSGGEWIAFFIGWYFLSLVR